MDSGIIFHITTRKDWEKAQAAGALRPALLHDIGYLHGSLRHQVMPVVNSVFRKRNGLLLLEIDVAKLTAKVKNEDLRKSGSPYPHIYGGINCKAVLNVYPLEPKADGTFDWPKGLSAEAGSAE